VRRGARPGGGYAGLKRTGYRYRLLPHVLALAVQVSAGAAGLYLSHLCEHALHKDGIAINAARLQ